VRGSSFKALTTRRRPNRARSTSQSPIRRDRGRLHEVGTGSMHGSKNKQCATFQPVSRRLRRSRLAEQRPDMPTTLVTVRVQPEIAATDIETS